MQRVAAADAPDGQPRSPKSPMFFDRFDPIFRTGRKKAAAVAHKRADRRLIETNEKYNHYFHEMSV